MNVSVIFVKKYYSRTNNLVFMYKLVGSPEALEQYKRDKGEYLRFIEVDGEPTEDIAFFSTTALPAPGGKFITLKRTTLKSNEVRWMPNRDELVIKQSMARSLGNESSFLDRLSKDTMKAHNMLDAEEEAEEIPEEGEGLGDI